MTRREDRREESRRRAEEHARKRKMRFWAFVIALGLYVGVPVLWYGAIEFELVRPIKTPEFSNALRLLSLVGILVVLELYSRWKGYGFSSRKKSPTKTPTVSTT